MEKTETESNDAKQDIHVNLLWWPRAFRPFHQLRLQSPSMLECWQMRTFASAVSESAENLQCYTALRHIGVKYAPSLSHLHLSPICNSKSTSGWDGKCITDIADY